MKKFFIIFFNRKVAKTRYFGLKFDKSVTTYIQSSMIAEKCFYEMLIKMNEKTVFQKSFFSQNGQKTRF